MEIIEHKGKKFITINGKQFYFHQGYQVPTRRYSYSMDATIFLQVYGKVPLHYEDLPDRKWIIIKTRIPGRDKKGERQYIYTAYDKDYFDLDTSPFERKGNQPTYFIGRTKLGSAYLVISTLARLYELSIPEDRMMQLAERLSHAHLDIKFLQPEKDFGNLNNTAFCLTTFGDTHWGITAEYLKEKFGLEPKKKNGRKKRNAKS